MKTTASYRDKIVKQSCYFVKVLDGEFIKKHMGVNLFSLQLCVLREQMLKILCEKATKCVSRCWGHILEDFGSIVESFDKSRKLMTL